MKTYIIGAGSLGKEIKMVIDQINERARQHNLAGFIDDKEELKGLEVSGLPVIGNTDFLLSLKEQTEVVIAVNVSETRESLYNKLKKNALLKFPSIIHPTARIEKSTLKMGLGNIVCINAILSTEVSMGDFNVINMNALIAHDANIGSFNTFNPSTNISGGVEIGDHCDFGVNCSVIQNIKVESHSKLSGNSYAVKGLESGWSYIGIPAKKFFKHR